MLKHGHYNRTADRRNTNECNYQYQYIYNHVWWVPIEHVASLIRIHELYKQVRTQLHSDKAFQSKFLITLLIDIYLCHFVALFIQVVGTHPACSSIICMTLKKAAVNNFFSHTAKTVWLKSFVQVQPQQWNYSISQRNLPRAQLNW